MRSNNGPGIEEIVLAEKSLAPYYQLERYRVGPTEKLKIHVEVRPGISEETGVIVQDILGGQIKARIGINVDVVVHDTGSVARSEGKAVRVVDKR